jgi:periplasmic protein CpxP/Spy
MNRALNTRIAALTLAAVAAVGVATATAGGWQGPGGHRFHGGPPGPPDPAAMAARMTEHLGLSAEQAEKVTAILTAEHASAETYHTQLRAADEQLRVATANGAFDDASVRQIAGTKAQAMTELEVGHARARSQIYAILTPEQRAQADAMETSRPGRFGRAAGGEQKGRRPR